MKDQLPLGSWPSDLNPAEHSYLLPAPFQDVAVNDERWNAELLQLRRRPVLSPQKQGRTWHPAPILHQLTQDREPGNAIDLGCGNGRDAVWLAANGWNVTAIDRLPECEARVSQLADHHGVGSRIKIVIGDIASLPTETTFDLVLAHYTYIEDLAQQANRLKGGAGIVSVLSHSKLHFDCFGSPPHHEPIGKVQKEFWSRDRHLVWSIYS